MHNTFYFLKLNKIRHFTISFSQPLTMKVKSQLIKLLENIQHFILFIGWVAFIRVSSFIPLPIAWITTLAMVPRFISKQIKMRILHISFIQPQSITIKSQLIKLFSECTTQCLSLRRKSKS